MSHRRKFRIIFLTLAAPVVFGFFKAVQVQAINDVDLHASYKGGVLDRVVPEGGLEPNSDVELFANFSGEPNVCDGSLNYKLFHALAHAKGGNVNDLEYLARGEGGTNFDYTFNSNQYGQKNVYQAVFYCWSSNSPETALGTAQQWKSPFFDQTTTGGTCDFSNIQWSKSSGKVGDTVGLSVKGDTAGCKGINFGFEIWRGGKDLGNRLETTINSSFSATGTPPLTANANWQISGNQKYAFKIRLPGGTDNCARATNGTCLWSGDLIVSASPTPSKTASASFEFKNPINTQTFQELIAAIYGWIFYLTIPIAVIVIIYAGFRMLNARGVPAEFQKGKDALKWAVIGLAVVFIGQGFIYLIQSIINLKNR